MAAIPMSLSNTVKVPAALAPVDMSFVLDSGGETQCPKGVIMSESWNDHVVEPAENLVF